MSDLLDTALVLARKGDTDALIELLQNARRWRSGDSSDGVRNLTGDQVIAALGYQPATQAEAGTGETTIKDALGYVPAQSQGGVGLSGNEKNKLNIASQGVGNREIDTEVAGSGLTGGDRSPLAVDQTVARTDRDEVFTGDVALDDGAGTGGLLRGDEDTVEVRKQGAPTQYGRLRASEVEVVDGNTATELRSQVVEISDSLLETNTDAAADAWGGLYTYRGRKEDATGTGLISKGIAWSPAAKRFGQVDVDARKNDSGDNVGSGVQTSTFAPYARVNRAESITKDWTFGGDIGTGDFVSRTTGWQIQPDGSADFRKMWADELKVQAFTADVAQALVGTEIITKSRATLAENFTVPPSGSSATLTVEDIDGQKGTRAFEAGDTVRLRVVNRSGGGLLVADVWGTVNSYSDNGDGTQSWTYSVTDDGAADGKVVYEGAVALDWGTSGDGQIYSTVLDDAGSPYTDVRTWTDTGSDGVPDSYDSLVRLGVLDGISGLSGAGLYTEKGRFTRDILIGSLDKSGSYLEFTQDGGLKVVVSSGDVDQQIQSINSDIGLLTQDVSDNETSISQLNVTADDLQSQIDAQAAVIGDDSKFSKSTLSLQAKTNEDAVTTLESKVGSDTLDAASNLTLAANQNRADIELLAKRVTQEAESRAGLEVTVSEAYAEARLSAKYNEQESSLTLRADADGSEITLDARKTIVNNTLTAEKLKVDQTMTSNLLAEDATVRGTLDMGDKSQNTWGKIRMGAGQNAFYLGDFALASQNSETGTLFGSNLASGSGGASRSDGPKTYNFSQSTDGRTVTVIVESSIYASADQYESESADAEVTVELYDGNNNNYDTKKATASVVAVNGETKYGSFSAIVWEADAKLNYVKVYRSVDSSSGDSQAIIEHPITIYNSTSEDFFGPQGGVWRRNGQPRIAFDVGGDSFSESTSGEGTVIADNHTTWSDPSIKEQAEEVTRGLDVVRGLRPARYTRIESRQAHFGFMADEVHQVIPEITRPPTTEQDRWAYNPMELLAPMVGAIQTVDDKTTELERRVGALEDRIDTLTANR